MDGAFCLRDVVGMTWVNDAEDALGKGRVVALRDGDVVRIGPFAITVALTGPAGSGEGCTVVLPLSVADLFDADQVPLWEDGGSTAVVDEVALEVGPVDRDPFSTHPCWNLEALEPLSALDEMSGRLRPLGTPSSADLSPAAHIADNEEVRSGQGAAIPTTAMCRWPRAR